MNKNKEIERTDEIFRFYRLAGKYGFCNAGTTQVREFAKKRDIKDIVEFESKYCPIS